MTDLKAVIAALRQWDEHHHDDAAYRGMELAEAVRALLTARAVAPQEEERQGCPCLYTTPCQPECTCVSQASSAGCQRCCRYGSPEQQKAMAEHLAVAAPHYEEDNHHNALACPYCNPKGLVLVEPGAASHREDLANALERAVNAPKLDTSDRAAVQAWAEKLAADGVAAGEQEYGAPYQVAAPHQEEEHGQEKALQSSHQVEGSDACRAAETAPGSSEVAKADATDEGRDRGVGAHYGRRSEDHREVVAAPARAEREWQPIAAAPKEALAEVLGNFDGVRRVMWWSALEGWMTACGATSPAQPTHWMPLPEPPAARLPRPEAEP
jgi:hypothetical protein